MGFLFNTDQNNQKILYNQGTTLAIGSPTFGATLTIDHNLGYIPAARVWYEATPGKWYPLSVRQYNDSMAFDFLNIIGDFYLTDTQMVVTIRNGGVATSVDVWVRIYLDD